MSVYAKYVSFKVSSSKKCCIEREETEVKNCVTAGLVLT